MKKLFFLALMACGFCSQAQGDLTITVADSTTGLPIGGVRVLYYFSTDAFYGTGNAKPPTYEQFDHAAYTDTNGVISFSVASRTPGDTLFWATKDCSGNYFWGSDTIPTANNNITDTITISCPPSDCDVVFMVRTFSSSFGIIKAYPMRAFSYTSLPSGIPSNFTYYDSSGVAITSVGFTNSNHDSVTVMNTTNINYCYSRVDSFCTTTCDTIFLNGGTTSPLPLSCEASYGIDTVNSGIIERCIFLFENSSTNGNIIRYDWDFGDGATSTAQYPTHVYSAVWIYEVCLTITALDGAGTDTCVTTYCDTIGFDPMGRLVHKEATGFTINIIDPATVGLEEQILGASLSLYPNPAADKVQVTWDRDLTVQKVAVFSITGQKLRDFQPSANKAEITGLASGAYLVRVSGKNATKTIRLIIQ